MKRSKIVLLFTTFRILCVIVCFILFTFYFSTNFSYGTSTPIYEFHSSCVKLRLILFRIACTICGIDRLTAVRLPLKSPIQTVFIVESNLKLIIQFPVSTSVMGSCFSLRGVIWRRNTWFSRNSTTGSVKVYEKMEV